LDVDGNGIADALSDGILILRYLFDPNGPWNYSDALGSGATRTTRSAIKAFLDQYNPSPVPSLGDTSAKVAFCGDAPASGLTSPAPNNLATAALGNTAAAPLETTAATTPAAAPEYDLSVPGFPGTGGTSDQGELTCEYRPRKDDEPAKAAEVRAFDKILQHWSPSTARDIRIGELLRQRDVTFQEDPARLRLGHTDVNFSILRRAALSLPKNNHTFKVGVKNRCLVAGWDDEYLAQILFEQ